MASPAGADRDSSGSGPLDGPAVRLQSADDGPVPDRPSPAARPAVRSWPLLVLAAPAAAEVWSGWVGIASRTGFGRVSLLPGILPSLHLDTTITLPVGVEAYAAYALRAWLSPGPAVSDRTRQFARRSAIFSFTLGAAGQVAYHLLEQARITRAPWAVTTVVSCLPVLVLAMGTVLAHMLHADAAAAAQPPAQGWTAADQSAARSHADRARPGPYPDRKIHRTSPPSRTRQGITDLTGTGPEASQPPMSLLSGAHQLTAARLIAAGQPVSRRALRANGVRGSNDALNALARVVNDELARLTQQLRPVLSGCT
jgi:hypothetical protein